PAQVFMGDVGSLALGAALGVVAVIVRQEIVLFIMGGIFVAETVSVILQVASFKMTGKRIFRMAPLHHHYELKGWPEPRVIVRFSIITIILVLVGLATLKIRSETVMTAIHTINKRMIVGLGMTGLSAARWCQRQGYAFDLCDT